MIKAANYFIPVNFRISWSRDDIPVSMTAHSTEPRPVEVHARARDRRGRINGYSNGIGGIIFSIPFSSGWIQNHRIKWEHSYSFGASIEYGIQSLIFFFSKNIQSGHADCARTEYIQPTANTFQEPIRLWQWHLYLNSNIIVTQIVSLRQVFTQM